MSVPSLLDVGGILLKVGGIVLVVLDVVKLILTVIKLRESQYEQHSVQRKLPATAVVKRASPHFNK